MERSVVISQSMYFPWVGLLEQIRLSDFVVHYDDVQYSKGSFTNRVQIKSSDGVRWMTIPLRQVRLGQLINQIVTDEACDWRRQHLSMLESAYAGAPFLDDMLTIVHNVHSLESRKLSDLARASMVELLKYFGIYENKNFFDSSMFGISGSKSGRVHDLVVRLKGNRYITGHGAKNYLDHELFEKSDISVEYMDYRAVEYKQLHGEFTPFVSALDLVANLGRNGREIICSQAVPWRQFIGRTQMRDE
jgi:hypothetical protein